MRKPKTFGITQNSCRSLSAKQHSKNFYAIYIGLLYSESCLPFDCPFYFSPLPPRDPLMFYQRRRTVTSSIQQSTFRGKCRFLKQSPHLLFELNKIGRVFGSFQVFRSPLQKENHQIWQFILLWTASSSPDDSVPIAGRYTSLMFLRYHFFDFLRHLQCHS